MLDRRYLCTVVNVPCACFVYNLRLMLRLMLLLTVEHGPPGIVGLVPGLALEKRKLSTSMIMLLLIECKAGDIDCFLRYHRVKTP